MSTALYKYVSKKNKPKDGLADRKKQYYSPSQPNTRKNTLERNNSHHHDHHGKSMPSYLPKLSTKIILKEEKTLNNVYNSRKQLFQKNRY